MDKQALITLARQAAEKYGLDGDLVCAIVEQESNWNPWAIRYEPGFFTHYILPMLESNQFSASEANARSTSWGLMQVMGEVAREKMFGGPFLSELCDPATGLDIGCKYFSSLMGQVGNDVTKALLRWNGGGDPGYAAEVQDRISSYSA